MKKSIFKIMLCSVAFTFAVSASAEQSPVLTGTWGQSGSGSGQFSNPAGAVGDSQGNIYVADKGNSRIEKFTSSGTFILSWGTSGSGQGQFSSPMGLAIDASDKIYVADAGNSRIQIFNTVGAFQSSFGSYGSGTGQFNYPSGVSVDAATGNIYVADTKNGRIQKFDASGNFLATWGSPGSAAGQFQTNSPFGIGVVDVDVDGTGNVYTLENATSSYYGSSLGFPRIQKFNTGGTPLASWTPSLAVPNSLAIDSSGNVYVADGEGGANSGGGGNVYHNQVHKFDPAGTSLVSWGATGAGQGEFQNLNGIVVSASGDVWVVDVGNNRVQRFGAAAPANPISGGGTAAPVLTGTWGQSGSGSGQFSNPAGAVGDSQGNIYVADKGNSRIEKFTSSGTFILSWGTSGSGEGQFSSPMGLAIDASDKIYVADAGNSRIQIFNTAGAFQSSFGSYGSGTGQFNYPSGVSVDAATGNIYVADTKNGRIQKFDASGNFLATWGSPGSAAGQFQTNSPFGIGVIDVDVDGTGNVYTLENATSSYYGASLGFPRIQRFSPEGAVLASWGETTLAVPNSLAIDSSGNVYVADGEGGSNTGGGTTIYHNHIYKYNSTGTSLTSWGATGAGQGEFQNLNGIVVSASGDVWVVDVGNNRVQRFGAAAPANPISGGGTTAPVLTGTWGQSGTGIGQFNFPGGAAIDSQGNIYVTDRDTNRVQKFTSSGAYITAWGSSGTSTSAFNDPRGLAVDASDRIYVADMNNHRVQVFTSTGGFWCAFGGYGSGGGQFSSPQGVAVDINTGDIFVADAYTRVQKFGPNRDFLLTWGNSGAGSGQFSNLRDIKVDGSGNVYTAEYGGGNNRIQRFSPYGVFLSSWGGSGSADGKFGSANAIAVDSVGNVYVADGVNGGYTNNRVQKFNSTGTYLTSWGSSGSGQGQFSFDASFSGLVADPYGNIYVVDTFNRRIQRFGPSAPANPVTGGGATAPVLIGAWGQSGTGNGKFSTPAGAGIDSQGNIYIVDSNNHRVQKFNSTGAYITAWGSSGISSGAFNYPHGLAVDAADHIYVADTHNHRIQIFTSTGGFWGAFGGNGSSGGQFSYPHGVAVDTTTGDIFVADSVNYRVQKFDANHNFISTWGDDWTGFGHFSYLADIKVDGSGNVYTAEQGVNNRIQKFSPHGAFLTSWGGAGSGNSQFGSANGIAVDAAGNVYVADGAYGSYTNNRVQKFNSTGAYLASWGSTGSGSGQFSFSSNFSGLAANAFGNIYVVDPVNNRVQIFGALPAAPSSFAGTALSSVSIQWTWVDNADNESGYRVRSDSWTNISGDLAAGTVAWMETGLAPNASYSRYVEVFNGDVASSSTVVSTYTFAAAPVNPALTLVSSTSLSAEWGGNGNAAGTRYELSISSDSGFGVAFTTATLLTADTTSYAATGLPGGTVIYVRVRAKNAGDTGYSAYVQTDILTPAQPSKPATLAGATASATSIQWSWGASTFVTEYRIYTSTDGYITAVSSSALTYTETGLSPNVQYTRYVRAWNVAYQNDSDPASAYTAAAVPASLTLTVQSRTSLTAAWGANGNPAGTKYQVDYSTDAGFYGDAYSTTTATSISIGGLTPGAVYYARAKAFNTAALQTSTVTASETPWALPVITVITPSSATNSGTAGITVTGTGTGLRAGDTARLEMNGAVLATTSTIVNATCFLAAFNMLGVDPGVWNIIIGDAEGNESALSSATQFTVSTGTSEGGVVITPLPSTGTVATTGDLTVTVSSGIPELLGGYIFLSTDPIHTPLRVSSGAVAGAGITQGNTFISNTAVEIVAFSASQQVTSFSSSTVEVSITYPDSSPADGIVDGTNVQETNLYMVWLDTATGDWSRIPSTVDTVNNKVLANVSHFSVFGVAGVSTMADLSTAKVYPNPWKPGSGGSHDRVKLKFDNLADNTSVKIYNLVGELVDSLAASSVGFLEWDGKTDGGEKATSGVYFAYVKSTSGQKVLKFAIER